MHGLFVCVLRTNVTLTRALAIQNLLTCTHMGGGQLQFYKLYSLGQNIVDAPVLLQLNHVRYDDYTLHLIFILTLHLSFQCFSRKLGLARAVFLP